VHAQPFEVGDAGRMALVQDPTGAMFALWQARERPGAETMHVPGAMDWFELATNDPEKAGAFYEQVLGWDVQREEFDGTTYTTCRVGDEAVAGILPGDSLPEGVPPNWSVYFAVEDCAATVEKAQQAGAELIFGPQDMPSVGQFAGLRDPQGAAFAVIQPVGEQAEDESGRGEGQREEGEAEDGDARDERTQDEGEESSSDDDSAEDQSSKDEAAKNEPDSEQSEKSQQSEQSEQSEEGRSEKGASDEGEAKDSEAKHSDSKNSEAKNSDSEDAESKK
jgi:predicted enzyme related to lactoylglutathione lyase